MLIHLKHKLLFAWASRAAAVLPAGDILLVCHGTSGVAHATALALILTREEGRNVGIRVGDEEENLDDIRQPWTEVYVGDKPPKVDSALVIDNDTYRWRGGIRQPLP